MAKKVRFTVVTCLATASFPHLDKPDPFIPKGKKPDEVTLKYKLKLIFDDGADMRAIEAKALEAIRHEWGEKIKPAVVKSCIKDGDTYNKDREDNGKEPNEYLAGRTFIDASSKYQPQVVDAKKHTISPKLVRGGDRVKAILELIPCEPSGKKTIGVRLLSVQLVEKRSGDGSGWADAFEEEDGFEGDEEAGGEKSEGGSGSGSGGGDGHDDF